MPPLRFNLRYYGNDEHVVVLEVRISPIVVLNDVLIFPVISPKSYCHVLKLSDYDTLFATYCLTLYAPS